jgi:hypothetical protein
MELLSHPFRLDPAGAAATVTEGTEVEIEEALSILVSTRKRERELVPDFGVTDPTFAELDLAEMNAALAVFGPDVVVSRLRRSPRTDIAEDVELEWRLPDDDDA